MQQKRSNVLLVGSVMLFF